MRISGSKRARGGGRKMDLTPIRRALRDRRVWGALGLVHVPEGEDSHFEIDDDVGVLVHVQMMPLGTPLFARLGGFGAGGNGGVWRIPPVGSEVALLIPDGEPDDEAYIVGVLASGSVPPDLDENTIVIIAPAGGQVMIHDGSGAQPLVTKAAYEAHVHPTGTGPSGVANNATDEASYTSVLVAK